MSEPKRLESVLPEAADRDSQAEALLVDGLDRYFAGRYEDAIHLWTRVLFIDRSHARARAYIDRARSAMAERQRKTDELLQTSRDLLDQGHVGAARDLLTQAVAAGGEDEHASALRVTLERHERVHAVTRPAPAGAVPSAEPVLGWAWPRRSPALLASVAALAALAVVLFVIAVTSAILQEGFGTTSEVLRPSVETVKLPVLSSSDVALVRARTLFDRGRLAEALQALDRVGPESPARGAADALRIQIQQLLLASSREPFRARAADPNRR
jgi:tetratricopeptide (TPR) repeat protein